MRRAFVIALVLATTARAAADDDVAPATAHARSSVTFYLGKLASPGPTVPLRASVDAALRVHQRRIAFELRLGGGGAGSVVGLGGHATGHAGVSVGGALALGGRVVVAPMLAYDGYLEWEHRGSSFAVHQLTMMFPISILVTPRAVLEIVVQGGVARYHGVTDPAIQIGPRLGITL